MTAKSMPLLHLTLPLERSYLAVATAFSESAGLALGLGPADALKLTLATEEVYDYLSRHSPEGEVIRMEAQGGGFYAQLTFRFPPRQMDLRLLNLTATLSLQDETDLDQLGLLIASRSVERLLVLDQPPHGLGLVLIKEKTYPPPAQVEPEAPPLQSFSLAEPGPEQIKLLSHLVAAHQPPRFYPRAFALPGMLVDMIASGSYAAAVALGQPDQVAGGIIWHWPSPRTVRFYGPYLFNQPAGSGMAEALVEACLGRIAKGEAVGLIGLGPPPELPEGYFELLGTLDYLEPGGQAGQLPCLYRQLQEDPGARVWAHPQLKDFLEQQYKRLFLARDIMLTSHEGEKLQPHSVLGADIDRSRGLATLRPMWDGADLAANLAQHQKVLQAEGVANLYLELDLSLPWQARLFPAVQEAGFEPRLVMPYGGGSDLVVFQQGG